MSSDTTSIGAYFPQWFAASRVKEAVGWNAPCEFDQFATSETLRVLLAEDYAQLPPAGGPADRGRYEAMNSIFGAIRGDYSRLTKQRADPPWPELVGFVPLLGASARVAGIAHDRGDIRAWRRALIEALIEEATAQSERSSYIYLGRVLALCHPDQPLPDSIVSEPLVRWGESVFVYDRFTGSFSSFAEPLYRSLEPWVIARLGSDEEYAFLALAMAQWAARRDVDDRNLLAAIESLAARHRVPKEAAPRFAILEAHRLTALDDLSAATRARELLEEFRERLTGTEMFELVGYSTHNTSIAVYDHKSILAATEALMRDWRRTTPDPLFMADRRGAHFPIVGNVISSLLEHGRADLIGPTLGAWIEVPPEERRNDLIFWIVSGAPGFGWAFNRTVRLAEDIPAVLAYIGAAGRFTNLALATVDAPEGDTWVRNREGAWISE